MLINHTVIIREETQIQQSDCIITKKKPYIHTGIFLVSLRFSLVHKHVLVLDQ